MSRERPRNWNELPGEKRGSLIFLPHTPKSTILTQKVILTNMSVNRQGGRDGGIEEGDVRLSDRCHVVRGRRTMEGDDPVAAFRRPPAHERIAPQHSRN